MATYRTGAEKLLNVRFPDNTRTEAEMWALHRERHRLAARHAIYVVLGLSLGLYALGWGVFVLLRAAIEAWVAPFL